MWSKESELIVLNTREMIFLKAYRVSILHVEGWVPVSHFYTLGGSGSHFYTLRGVPGVLVPL